MFVVGTIGMTETGGDHGEPAGVPGVGYCDGVGGERSEDVGRRVCGNVAL
jgi:hypothetical protein